MRIRKRQVPLPLSSLSHIPPLSDPHSNGSPSLQLHQHHAHEHDPYQNLSQQADATCNSQPSDHPIQSIGCQSSLDYHKDEDCLVLLEDGNGDKSNDSRKNSILAEEKVAAGVLSQLSNVVIGRYWYEGEKTFPLEKDNKKKMKKKTKINNKVDDDDDNNNNSNTSSSKKRGRSDGGAIMEGSRCSRVNGRGWRCCEKTLVGYSLCEHHLGKGRLRSMDSVRSGALGSSALKTKNKKSRDAKKLASSNSSQELLVSVNYDEEEEDDDDDQKPLMIAKKRSMKLGMVKARSISSLLGQMDNEIIAAD